jgi:hypothetical protein
MSLPPSMLNVSDLTIKRPGRPGRGGDRDPAQDQTLASGLSAFHEMRRRLIKRQDGGDVVSSALYLIDPPTTFDVRVGDLVLHTDALGRALGPKAIVEVRPAFLGPDLHHVELSV